jgi:hypothetical protein
MIAGKPATIFRNYVEVELFWLFGEYSLKPKNSIFAFFDESDHEHKLNYPGIGGIETKTA